MCNSRYGDSEVLSFNGINGATGEPLHPHLTPGKLASFACDERWDPAHLEELKNWHETAQEDHMDVRFGIDPRRIEEAGWGVIFSSCCDPAVRAALEPLLEHRRAQAKMLSENRYREFIYYEGESKLKFLARQGAGPGPVNPEKVPYYLMIVGGPGEISFSFQYQLDVQHAVGRLHFETVDEYASYAQTVVEVEQGKLRLPKRLDLFAVSNQRDRPTHRSLRQLAEPLAANLNRTLSGWKINKYFAERATKERLGRIFAGREASALVFTASHGVGFDEGHPLQLSDQGAILCQDWPGPQEDEGPILRDHYFAAEDLSDAANVAGAVLFSFACYAAGTPKYDSFTKGVDDRRSIAPWPFIARLPSRLLGHPKGGALAMIGHVDRAWSYSFDWPRAGEQLNDFQSAVERLCNGYPVGSAMEYFNQRYAELSSELNWEREEILYGKKPDFLAISSLWVANNDARSYVVLGDPAVRLAV